MLEVEEWTIVQDDVDWWVAYPTKDGRYGIDFHYFTSVAEAVEFCTDYLPAEEV